MYSDGHLDCLRKVLVWINLIIRICGYFALEGMFLMHLTVIIFCVVRDSLNNSLVSMSCMDLEQ